MRKFTLPQNNCSASKTVLDIFQNMFLALLQHLATPKSHHIGE